MHGRILRTLMEQNSKEAERILKKTKRKTDISRVCDMAHICDHQASTDVLGSYTGTGADGESPVQDADDL